MTSEPEMGQTSVSESDNSDIFDTIVVGAGAAGIGVGIALAHSGVGNFVIIDKGSVGSSFASPGGGPPGTAPSRSPGPEGTTSPEVVSTRI